MTQGVLNHTLAALGYFFISILPFNSSLASNQKPVAQSIQDYSYMVKKGETMTDIAEEVYGSREYWTTIWKDNPEITNPSNMSIASKLRIRLNKPLLVDTIEKEQLNRVVNDVNNKPLSPSLPFFAAADKSAGASAKSIPTPFVRSVNLSENTSQIEVKQSPYDDIYKEAGTKFGIPWQILYGLHLTETGLRDGAIFNAGGSGARGPMQFMPGTWNAYGVDGDGDGVANIDNAKDAIYGAANFIVRHGGVTPGLRYYGGNTAGVLAAARARGYTE